MNATAKLKFWINFHLTVIVVLLLCITTTPLLIRHGLAFNQNLIVGEEIMEIMLITFLFGVSYLIFKSLKHTISVYETTVILARTEKLSLTSRLSDAFKYIGAVNSEIHEIQTILNGMDRYPVTKREFKQIFESLTVKAATIAKTPWAVIRIINKSSGRTTKEHACQIVKESLPRSTVGNRTILNGNHKIGYTIIQAHPKNSNLCSVCILPQVESLNTEQTTLLTAIANQAELYFLLYRKNDRNPYQESDLTDFTVQGKTEKNMTLPRSL